MVAAETSKQKQLVSECSSMVEAFNIWKECIKREQMGTWQSHISYAMLLLERTVETKLSKKIIK